MKHRTFQSSVCFAIVLAYQAMLTLQQERYDHSSLQQRHRHIKFRPRLDAIPKSGNHRRRLDYAQELEDGFNQRHISVQTSNFNIPKPRLTSVYTASTSSNKLNVNAIRKPRSVFVDEKLQGNKIPLHAFQESDIHDRLYSDQSSNVTSHSQNTTLTHKKHNKRHKSRKRRNLGSHQGRLSKHKKRRHRKRHLHRTEDEKDDNVKTKTPSIRKNGKNAKTKSESVTKKNVSDRKGKSVKKVTNTQETDYKNNTRKEAEVKNVTTAQPEKVEPINMETALPEVNDEQSDGVQTVVLGADNDGEVVSSLDYSDVTEEYHVMTPPPAIGLFATVKELVMTVKDLYAQQQQDRQRMRTLERKVRSQRNDLKTSNTKMEEVDTKVNDIDATLSGLDKTAGNVRTRIMSLRGHHQRLKTDVTELKAANQEMAKTLDNFKTYREDLSEVKKECQKYFSDSSKKLKYLEDNSGTVKSLARTALRLRSSGKLDNRVSQNARRIELLKQDVDNFDQFSMLAAQNISDIQQTLSDYNDDYWSLASKIEDLGDDITTMSSDEIREILQAEEEDGDTDTNTSLSKDDSTLSPDSFNAQKVSSDAETVAKEKKKTRNTRHLTRLVASVETSNIQHKKKTKDTRSGNKKDKSRRKKASRQPRTIDYNDSSNSEFNSNDVTESMSYNDSNNESESKVHDYILLSTSQIANNDSTLATTSNKLDATKQQNVIRDASYFSNVHSTLEPTPSHGTSWKSTSLDYYNNDDIIWAKTPLLRNLDSSTFPDLNLNSGNLVLKDTSSYNKVDSDSPETEVTSPSAYKLQEEIPTNSAEEFPSSNLLKGNSLGGILPSFSSSLVLSSSSVLTSLTKERDLHRSHFMYSTDYDYFISSHGTTISKAFTYSSFKKESATGTGTTGTQSIMDLETSGSSFTSVHSLHDNKFTETNMKESVTPSLPFYLTSSLIEATIGVSSITKSSRDLDTETTSNPEHVLSLSPMTSSVIHSHKVYPSAVIDSDESAIANLSNISRDFENVTSSLDSFITEAGDKDLSDYLSSLQNQQNVSKEEMNKSQSDIIVVRAYITILEDRIEILEAKMINMTKTKSVDEIKTQLRDLIRNESAIVLDEVSAHEEELKNKTSHIRAELKKRDKLIDQIQNVAAHTSRMVTELANQVSAINMAEFLAHLQDSLSQFTKNVLTLDQWKTGSQQIINATLQNEVQITKLWETVQETTHSAFKLHERVNTVHSMARRWYRSLQGHVIRLNNTVQDINERLDNVGEGAESVQVVETVPDTKTKPSLELQSKMDSLHIQLLYNANRLSTVEAKLMNETLAKCRKTTSDLQQAAIVLSLREKQQGLKHELQGLQDKVKRIDISVYRVHNTFKTQEKALNTLQTDMLGLKPATDQLQHLQQEVENLLHHVPKDCDGYYQRGFLKSGVYVIHPNGMTQSIRAYCIMEVDKKVHTTTKTGSNKKGHSKQKESSRNKSKLDEEQSVNDEGDKSKRPDARSKSKNSYTGGWTVIQNRKTGKVNFTKTFIEYENGFGDIKGDYWLGNDALHLLTLQGDYELRILMSDFFSSVWEARYKTFKVGPKGDNYRLQVNGYHGNASNGLSFSDKMAFSSVDADNDASSSHCALYNGGAWWYSHCHVSNLNGPYNVGMVWYNRAWQDWVQMKSTQMMIRPKRQDLGG